MSNSIAQYLTGKGITVVQFKPLTIASDGSYTVGTTAVSIQGYLDTGGGIEAEIETEQIRPVTGSKKNPVATFAGTTYTFGEIERTGVLSGNGCYLENMYYSGSGYWQLTYTRGGRTHTAIVLMTSFSDNIAEGKIAAIAKFETVDNNDPAGNPGVA